MPRFSSSSTAASNFWFDQTFAVGTHYIEVPTEVHTALSMAGDGTAAATWTVEWTDFSHDLSGAALVPTEASSDPMWKADAAVGTLTIAASTGDTGGSRVVFSNAPRRAGRAKLAVTVAGRIVGAWSGIS